MENKINDILKLIGLKVGERIKVWHCKYGDWELEKSSTYHVNEKGFLVKDGHSWNKWTTMDLFNGNLKFQSLYTQLPKIPFPIIPTINELENDIDVSGNKKVRL